MTKAEPEDKNNQDVSSLVGNVDIRMLGMNRQNDTDAYSYSGILNRAIQGLLEFVEMFNCCIIGILAPHRSLASWQKVGSKTSRSGSVL